MEPNSPPSWVALGRVSGVFGVQGWIKVHSYTRPREGILAYSPWCLGSAEDCQRYTVLAGHSQGRGLVAQLEGITDRDAASTLVGQGLMVAAKQLPPLPPGQYYWSQLEGLQVQTLSGEPLGRVDYLIETGANDVLVVQGERERLLPYIPEVVQRVDLDHGIMWVDWDPEF